MPAAERGREDRKLLEIKKQNTKSSQSLEAEIQKVWVISLLFRYRNTMTERKKAQWSAASPRYALTIHIMVDVHLIFYYAALTKQILMA